MALRCSQSGFVPRPPAQVFARIEDFSSAHQWMDRCIRVQKYERGENAVGDGLRCFYQGWLRHRVLLGCIVAREPDVRLTCEYAGRHARIGIDFTLRHHGAGTYLTHTLQVVPRGWLGRLAAPLVRRALARQSSATLASLRRCLLMPS
ncbi:SRPBCC family protein [Dyella sp. ASV21]|jgi:hypothetical protein|uniref:SRPBCC family protein n=1 Tax=Dyella sp. ASV21 TaxID=2795114 RepID=UPI0018EB8949|nr:SRPBCC family protein [Dyella sp. ASV21]